jgi:hypothetical protein
MDINEDFQDPINLHYPATMQGGPSFLGGDKDDDDDFVDPPPRPPTAECSDPALHIDTPEDLFKQSVSRRGLCSGNTGRRKRQDPNKKKLLEVTEANGISLVATINCNVDIHKEVFEMLTKTQVNVCHEQISNMQQRILTPYRCNGTWLQQFLALPAASTPSVVEPLRVRQLPSRST